MYKSVQTGLIQNIKVYFLFLFLLLGTHFTEGQENNSAAIKDALSEQGPQITLHISEDIYKQDESLIFPGSDKLNAPLRTLFHSFNRLGEVTQITERQIHYSPYALRQDKNGNLRIGIFIRLESEGNIGFLDRFDAQNITEVGTIVSASVPVAALKEIAAHPMVRNVEIGAKRSPLNNSGRADIGVDKIHDGIDLPEQFRGEGVIVGIIDTGIDFTHPDFSNEDGTRIKYLLEFTDNGENLWTKEDIDNDPESVTQRDGNDGEGHGTHVAGSAVGGGQFNSEYLGVAPESDIIIVDAYVDDNFNDDDILAGTDFIFNKADEYDKPAVVNLSLGGNFGPLDGTSAIEEALSSLTGEGKIIIAAAGNEGFDIIHAGADLQASERYVTLIEAHNPEQLVVNMWYDPGAVSQVAVGAFDIDEDFNLVPLGNTDFVQVGNFTDFTPFVVDDTTYGYVAVDALTVSDPNNGDGNIIFVIEGDYENDVHIDDVIWMVIYDSNESGRFDMWSLGGEFIGYPIGFDDVNEIPGDAELTVNTPATAEKVISVGSYVTKNNWTDIDGNFQQVVNPDREGGIVVPDNGQLSYFSSLGPTRDGRLAPDISAPGEFIFSALSSHMTEGEGYERSHVLEGDRYLGMSGTSMASPIVAGVVALMLQIDPTLTYEDVLSYLVETARTDDWTGAIPNNEFGYGKIDAYAAVNHTYDIATSVYEDEYLVPVTARLEQNYPNPFNPATTIRFAIPYNENVKLTVYNVLGQEVAVLVDDYKQAGSYEVTFDASHLPSGMYTYRIEAGDFVRVKKLMLVK